MTGSRHRAARFARLRGFAGLVAVAVVLAACGSTVQWDGTVPDGAGGTGDGLSVAGPVTTGPDGQPPGGARGGAGAGSGGAAAVAGGGLAVAGQGVGAAGPALAALPAGASGRGFTAKQIYIGWATFKDVAQAGQALGLTVDAGDQEAMAQAVANDINARGGIAGRKVVLVFFDIETQQFFSDRNALMQAACARWTEDRPVFAVVSYITAMNDETLFGCPAKKKTVLVLSDDAPAYASTVLSRYAPYLYAPTVTTLERLVPTWLRRSAANGYFGGLDIAAGSPGRLPAKIGLLTVRTPTGRVFEQGVRREFARQGRSVTATFEASPDGSVYLSELNQAVLRFRGAGVTHVVPGELFFIRAAEAQRYRPRYIVSYSYLLQSEAPKAQLAGTLGVGYSPTADVDAAHDPGDVSAAQSRCRKIMQTAGQDTSNRIALAVMVHICDGFEFIKAAAEKGGLSVAGMQRGARAIGSMPSASTFRVSFPGGRIDGASAVRDLGYRDSCGCFVYLSRTNHGT